jgi:hypothetical protein
MTSFFPEQGKRIDKKRERERSQKKQNRTKATMLPNPFADP